MKGPLDSVNGCNVRTIFKFDENLENTGNYFRNTPAEPSKEYFIEIQYNLNDDESKFLKLYVNGRYESYLLKKQEGKVYYKGLFEPVEEKTLYKGFSRFALKTWMHTNYPIVYDDVIISDVRQSSRPSRPVCVRPVERESIYCDTVFLESSGFKDPCFMNKNASSHWQASKTGSWVLPLYNSGETFGTATLHKVSHILPGKGCFAEFV